LLVLVGVYVKNEKAIKDNYNLEQMSFAEGKKLVYSMKIELDSIIARHIDVEFLSIKELYSIDMEIYKQAIL
jgi:hypothetical protein